MADAVSTDAAPTLKVTASPISDAARLLADAIRAGPPTTGPVRLAIPGGSAVKVLGPLREDLGTDGTWSRVALTWVDERCVPFADPDSNRGAAYQGGLLDDAAPPALELPLYDDGESPAEAVARVQAAWSTSFGAALDVVLLGMGEDGHIASLFPGAAALRGGAVAAIDDSPKPPPRRITLTREALATARTTVLVALGEGKRDALERVLAGDETLPAVGLPGLCIVTDVNGLGGRR